MRIVYCIPAIYASGGTERVVINKANYLVDAGYEVAIITTDQDGRQPFFDLDKRVKHYDIGINYYKNANRNLINKFYYYIRNRRIHRKRLEDLLQALQADIAVSLYMNEMSLLPYINDGSKKILEFHFSRPFFRINRRGGLKGLVDLLQEKKDISHIRRYDRFVVLTEEDKLNWPELNNVIVIHNASSLEGIHALNNRQEDVIAVGRYTRQKGFERLIDVWEKVATKVNLRIYGDGELKESLKEKIKDKKLDDRIILEPPTKDIKRVYENSALLVMTSLYEGLPMVMIEAQSCGVPIVSFDFPCGPKDIINNGIDGFLVPDGDLDSMALKIEELLRNDDLRATMGRCAKQNSSRFNLALIMNQWCELYSSIVNQ